jgi:Flp pilus assembly protein TadD
MSRHSLIIAVSLGLVLLGAGGSAVGIARAAPTAEEGGSTRNLYLLLIRQARTDGRARAALAYLDDFDRQYPGDLEARVLRVNCLLDLGQTDAARAAVDRIPANRRNGEASAARGHVLAAQGDWAEAAAQYRIALAASPANALTANALGYAELRAGRTGAAVETLKGAADLAPGNNVIRNNLLLALSLAGRTDEANERFRTIRDFGERATLRQQIADQTAQFSGASTPVASPGLAASATHQEE